MLDFRFKNIFSFFMLLFFSNVVLSMSNFCCGVESNKNKLKTKDKIVQTRLGFNRYSKSVNLCIEKCLREYKKDEFLDAFCSFRFNCINNLEKEIVLKKIKNYLYIIINSDKYPNEDKQKWFIGELISLIEVYLGDFFYMGIISSVSRDFNKKKPKSSKLDPEFVKMTPLALALRKHLFYLAEFLLEKESGCMYIKGEDGKSALDCMRELGDKVKKTVKTEENLKIIKKLKKNKKILKIIEKLQRDKKYMLEDYCERFCHLEESAEKFSVKMANGQSIGVPRLFFVKSGKDEK